MGILTIRIVDGTGKIAAIIAALSASVTFRLTTVS
jgi:hypothetical protein